MTRAREILVGVDGSPESSAAVTWAAHEAAARGFGLAIVHVNSIGSYGLWSTSRTVRDELRAMGQPVITDAVQTALAAEPDVPARGRVLLGSATRIMLVLSADAPLIVVGLRGRGALSRLILGSVAQRLLTHAHCPVVAVSGYQGTTGPHRVVLGTDEPPNETAEQFAFESARVHGAALLAVRVVGTDDVDARREQLAKRVSERWQDYADVKTDYTALAGDPVEDLAGICEPADVLVVGHHRHARYVPATLGPVLSGLVHHASCAIAVVPEVKGGEPHAHLGTRTDEADEAAGAAGAAGAAEAAETPES